MNTQSMRAMQNPAVVVAGSTRPTHVLFGVLQMALHRVCRRQARVAGRLHSRATKMRPEKQRALRVMQRAGENALAETAGCLQKCRRTGLAITPKAAAGRPACG